MNKMVYFTRHGRVFDGDKISDDEKDALEDIHTKLKSLGFVATFVISSTANRCIETANILAPNVKVVTRDKFHAFGTFKQLRKLAEELLFLIELALEKYDNVLVVTHDCLSTTFTLSLIEKRGGKVDWNNIPKNFESLYQGCGFLVEDKKFIYLEPYT